MNNSRGKYKNNRGFKVKSQSPMPSVPSVPTKSKIGRVTQWRGWQRWERFWSIFGPFATIISLCAYFAPGVAIRAGENLDRSQDFQTQFVVTNKGNVDLSKMRFVCELEGHEGPEGQEVHADEIQTNPKETLRRVGKLESGGAVSRGCFVKSRVPVSGRLKVTAYYTWISLLGETSQSAYFRVEHGATGNILVPDDDDSSSFHAFMKIEG